MFTVQDAVTDRSGITGEKMELDGYNVVCLLYTSREADYDKLMTRIQELGIPMKDMWWYLDTRTFGSCPHSCLLYTSASRVSPSRTIYRTV